MEKFLCGRWMGIALAAAVIGLSTANAAKEIKYTPKPSTYEGFQGVKKGGTFYRALSDNPKTINPIISTDANSFYMEPYFFATLLFEDTGSLELHAYLAESYTISADHKNYTFTLNKDAKWSDGTPITTADVKFTFDTMMDSKTDSAPKRAYWKGVTLEVKDPRTFTFKVAEPQFDTLRTLGYFPPVQKKQFEKDKNYNTSKGILNPVSSGPYTLKSFSRSQKIEAEKVKDWWGNNVVAVKNIWNPQTVVFRIIPDAKLEYERWLKGELDIIHFDGRKFEDYSRKVKGSDKAKISADAKSGKKLWTLEFENNAPRSYTYIGWNLRLPMFSSKKTRQALAQLADVQDIATKVYYGYAVQATSPFGTKTPNSDPELRKPGKILAYDPKKAIQLLKEDGWADTDGDNIIDKTINGKKVPFKFVLKFNSNNTARGKVAQILQQNFRKAGIQIDIRSMEWNAYLTDIDNRDFDAIVMGWRPTPYSNPRQIWHTDSEKNKGSNSGGYSNKKVDELIEKANVEFDLTKRAAILREINDILYDDQPYIWLTEEKSLILGFSNRIGGSQWALQNDIEPAFEIYQIAQ